MSELPYVSFVTNFLSYTSAKYYLNWLTIGKVVAEIKKGGLFY